MYSVSSAFHEAVAQWKPQKALLIFDDAVFTNDDINIENGIVLSDYFNAEDDLSIGQALSNELTFSLFNDRRTLNDYAFGDFLATIGVQISTGTYTQTGTAQVTTGNATYIGYSSSPYIKRDGAAVSSQPSFPVVSLLAYNGKVYAFGASDQYKVYDDTDGSDITDSNPLNAFMQSKGAVWNGKGMYYVPSTRMLYLWKDGISETYEFAPLGYFTAKRPNVPDVIQIDLHCNDFMQRFEKDMPSKTELNISYPITIGELFTALCDYVNVQYASSTFINSTATITTEPEEFENVTMRQVLIWIAEAAAANLRFNRDGQLVFDWLRNTSQTFDENGYREFSPYWYQTPQIDKLYNRNTQSSADITVGTGNNAYLIQDNPLLKGVT